MKVLFVISDIFLGEPIGVLQLSAILKKRGHVTRILPLRRKSLSGTLTTFCPDIIAYSAMSPEADLFIKADDIVKRWIKESNVRVLRIMGGPHPTYFPEILESLRLDAVCIGEGDNALPELIERFRLNKSFVGIPNVLVSGQSLQDVPKELITDLDSLPFPDKEVYFESMPFYRKLAIRSVMTSRGCPYDCTYCFNHAFREMFRGCGRIVRRRSVSNVIEEIKSIVALCQPVRLIKICDDTFAHTVDDWLREFVERYRTEIGLPFYCLMRSNTMSAEMAKMLSWAGCCSLGMSVEAGDEKIRNNILKRGLTDKVVISSFEHAHNHGLKTYGNTLLAIPGTSFEDDFKSMLFARKLRMTVPTFGIFHPYPKTELADYAVKLSLLEPENKSNNQFGFMTPLKGYTSKEKKMQLALSYLGTLFCDLPDSWVALPRLLLKLPLMWIYKYIGTAYMVIKTGWYIFPGIYPANPFGNLKLFADAIHFFVPGKDFNIIDEHSDENSK